MTNQLGKPDNVLLFNIFKEPYLVLDTKDFALIQKKINIAADSVNKVYRCS